MKILGVELLLIEPLGIETIIPLVLVTLTCFLLIEPLGIETLVNSLIRCTFPLLLIEPLGIETRDGYVLALFQLPTFN